ncbi:uncharacterized protein LOC130272739 isoform X2 [Hyla sarda]|uniref:uncharacterized protein LOC130272739 isoform X2 n=1 Tax=Hyla sarda TaxID=327740 RepID=UPI0024C449D8|nr:uncharacterized protein LOC130272739 isoform X2 [Hyla sarda]
MVETLEGSPCRSHGHWYLPWLQHIATLLKGCLLGSTRKRFEPAENANTATWKKMLLELNEKYGKQGKDPFQGSEHIPSQSNTALHLKRFVYQESSIKQNNVEKGCQKDQRIKTVHVCPSLSTTSVKNACEKDQSIQAVHEGRPISKTSVENGCEKDQSIRTVYNSPLLTTTSVKNTCEKDQSIQAVHGCPPLCKTSVNKICEKVHSIQAVYGCPQLSQNSGKNKWEKDQRVQTVYVRPSISETPAPSKNKSIPEIVDMLNKKERSFCHCGKLHVHSLTMIPPPCKPQEAMLSSIRHRTQCKITKPCKSATERHIQKEQECPVPQAISAMNYRNTLISLLSLTTFFLIALVICLKSDPMITRLRK